MNRFSKINMWLIAMVVAAMLAHFSWGAARAYATDYPRLEALERQLEDLKDDLADADDERPEDGKIIFHALAGAWFEALSLATEQEDSDGEIERLERKIKRLERKIEELKEAIAAGGGCFLPGTKVVMADGSLKEISQIKEGHSVRSYNVSKGVVEEKKVLETYVLKSDEYYLINGSLKATAQHPFLMAGESEVWKKASRLTVGDRVRSAGGEMVIESIKKVELADKINVYNFKVAQSKNYLVVDENGPYVVHNGL